MLRLIRNFVLYHLVWLFLWFVLFLGLMFYKWCFLNFLFRQRISELLSEWHDFKTQKSKLKYDIKIATAQVKSLKPRV